MKLPQNKRKIVVAVALSIGVVLQLASVAVAQLALPGRPAQPAPPTVPATAPAPTPAPASNPFPANLQGFGGPLAGLTRALIDAFNMGREEFINVETPATGLGPLFNGQSCAECHSVPVPGGGSIVRVIRFGRMVDGEFDPMENQGGSLLQRFATVPALQEVIPHDANVIAQRQSTPLFGLGLIEAIPDATIRQNAFMPKPDGIKGRAAEIIDVVSGQLRVGRFGWKAQQASLLAFSGDAYTNEMGITNRFFPKENAPNGNAALLATVVRTTEPDDEVDLLTGRGDIDIVADFMRFLAAPPRLSTTASSAVGDTLFTQIGCAVCHTPGMRTGTNPIAALDRKLVNLYSDLLLHEMGTLNDGIGQADASPREMKTPPLWGLRARGPYLHDGRATTIDAAIRAHDGEGALARTRYIRLSPQLRQNLIDFLGTL